MVWKLLKKLHPLYKAADFLKIEYQEAKTEAMCRDEVIAKRKEAIEGEKSCGELVKKHGGALCRYNEDDRLADDEVYRGKLVECHKKHSRFRWTLRGR